MANTRQSLAQLAANLDDSIGVRPETSSVVLSPKASPKDIGRRALRDVGTVEVGRIIPDPEQPRAEFSEEGIQRLASSIREKGQLAPIHVRWDEEAERWIIISGERRWRAARVAGLKTVDCSFHEGEMSESEIMEQMMIENLLREDLKPMEEARGFRKLMVLNGWNGKQVAEALRVPPSRVSRALALLRLPEEIQLKVVDGSLAASSAYELSKIGDDRTQHELAVKASSGELSRDETARMARKRRRENPKGRGSKLTFVGSGRWRVVVSAPDVGTYHEVETALVEAIEEVRLRIANGIRIN